MIMMSCIAHLDYIRTTPTMDLSLVPRPHLHTSGSETSKSCDDVNSINLGRVQVRWVSVPRSNTLYDALVGVLTTKHQSNFHML